MAIPISRPYSCQQDLQSMLDLLVAVRSAERLSDYPGIVDLRELLALHEMQDKTRLWFDGSGQLVGFALVDHYNNLLFEFDRQTMTPDIELEIVDWGVACVKRAMQALGENQTLDACCRGEYTDRIAFLERHGFMMQTVRSLHMIRPLDEPIPEPQAPAGFTIRHVAGEHEAEALVALHRAAFGTENMTVEERLAMMRVPGYDAELDLIAVAPNGQFAAYCMGSISEEENRRTGRNEGSTDPVATHPAFQRQGLAQALLLTGIQKLKERGIKTAVLGTSSENVAMQRVAEAVGFRVHSTTLWFAKPVSPDQAVS